MQRKPRDQRADMRTVFAAVLSGVSADFAARIQAYLQQLLSGYASQAKSGASMVSVSA